ncbi:MAG: hypothetical protein HUU08_13615 [Candidatus Brocadia sp.]|nr:hypothetical protein [Candidatus Brocadia sp.]
MTLELAYPAVDECTKDIITIATEIKKRQEDDFRYLAQKIDTNVCD